MLEPSTGQSAVVDVPTTNRPLAAIFLIVTVDVIGFAIMLPLLPFYVERLGAGAFWVGTLLSVYALSQLLAGPALGQLSDRFGRKPILLVSQFGTLVGFVLLALANSLPLLFLARIIDGLTAGNISVAQAYVTDNTAPSGRVKAFGVISAAFGLGMFLGPIMGGLLARYSLHAPLWAASAMSALSIVATFVLLPRGTAPPGTTKAEYSLLPLRALWQAFSNPATRNLFASLSAFFLAFVTFTSGLALFLAGRIEWQGEPLGPQGAGLLFAYAGLLNIAIQLVLLERLLRLASENRLIMLGFLAMTIGYMGLAVSRTLASAIVLLTFNTLGAGLLRPVVTAQISRSGPTQRQGLTMGLIQAIMAISQIIAPLLTGLLIRRELFSTWAICAALFAASGLLIASRENPTAVRVRS